MWVLGGLDMRMRITFLSRQARSLWGPFYSLSLPQSRASFPEIRYGACKSFTNTKCINILHNYVHAQGNPEQARPNRHGDGTMVTTLKYLRTCLVYIQSYFLVPTTMNNLLSAELCEVLVVMSAGNELDHS